MEKVVQIGIFGLGTVGKGVVEQLKENQSLIEKRVGAKLRITKAVTANPNKDRGLDLSGIQVSSNPQDILGDPAIDIVLELMGGDGLAKEVVLSALEQGKSVVTANKALLAVHSKEVFTKAYKSKGLLGFEASVAGGIPVIRDIKQGFAGDKILEISGIINGTANYILTSMTEAGEDFATALKKAQELGYAEADPTFDIEGIDAAHKLIILMDIAFNGLFNFNDLHVEGITGIEPIDIQIAKEFGYKIKLLGKALNRPDGYEGRVHPCLVSEENMLAFVSGSFNAVAVTGNFVGNTMSYGRGAGSHPTASAVVSDLVSISRVLQANAKKVVPPLSYQLENLKDKKLKPMSNIETGYYLRFTVQDKPGVLAKITRELGDKQISIRSMIQHSQSSDHRPVYVVIFTHQAREASVLEALKAIDSFEEIKAKTKLIRVDG